MTIRLRSILLLSFVSFSQTLVWCLPQPQAPPPPPPVAQQLQFNVSPNPNPLIPHQQAQTCQMCEHFCAHCCVSQNRPDQQRNRKINPVEAGSPRSIPGSPLRDPRRNQYQRTPIELTNFAREDSAEMPCIKAEGESDCFMYDVTRAALTLEEAIQNFADPARIDTLSDMKEELLQDSRYTTINMPRSQSEGAGSVRRSFTETSSNRNRAWLTPEESLPDYMNIPTPAHAAECSSNECRSCTADMLHRLAGANIQNGVVPGELADFLVTTQRRLRLSNTRSTRLGCSKFNAVGRSQRFVAPRKHRKKRANNERDAGDANRSDAGYRTSVRCDFRRGELIFENSAYCRLCSQCWAFRVLPRDYLPQLVNEVSCDHTDHLCLGGHAVCRPRYEHMAVLKQISSGTEEMKYAKEQIDYIASCECQVPLSSALIPLVRKNQTSNTRSTSRQLLP